MVTQTGLRVVRSNFARAKSILEKGQKTSKRPNHTFGASNNYLGSNFWNLAPKGPTWQPGSLCEAGLQRVFVCWANDIQPCSDAKLPVWRHDRQAMKLAALRWVGRKFMQIFRFDWIPIMWNSTMIRANNALFRTNRFLTYRTHSVALAFNETVRCCFYYWCTHVFIKDCCSWRTSDQWNRAQNINDHDHHYDSIICIEMLLNSLVG